MSNASTAKQNPCSIGFDEGGTKDERVYVVEGQAHLGDGWGPTNAASRFFRVKVAMPEE